MADDTSVSCKTVSPRFAPKPTKWVVSMRTFFPWQLFRFLWINVKMIRMIGISHKGELPRRKGL